MIKIYQILNKIEIWSDVVFLYFEVNNSKQISKAVIKVIMIILCTTLSILECISYIKRHLIPVFVYKFTFIIH